MHAAVTPHAISVYHLLLHASPWLEFMPLQNPDDLLFTSDASLGYGAAGGQYISGQIYYTAFQARFGHGGGGVVAMGIPAIAMFLCTCSSVTSNSRHARAHADTRPSMRARLRKYV